MSLKEYWHSFGVCSDPIHQQGHYSSAHRNNFSVLIDANAVDWGSDMSTHCIFPPLQCSDDVPPLYCYYYDDDRDHDDHDDYDDHDGDRTN